MIVLAKLHKIRIVRGTFYKNNFCHISLIRNFNDSVKGLQIDEEILNNSIESTKGSIVYISDDLAV